MQKINITQKQLNNVLAESINSVLGGVPRNVVDQREAEIDGLKQKAIELRQYIESCDYIGWDRIELNNIVRQILAYCTRKREGLRDLEIVG